MGETKLPIQANSRHHLSQLGLGLGWIGNILKNRWNFHHEHRIWLQFALTSLAKQEGYHIVGIARSRSAWLSCLAGFTFRETFPAFCSRSLTERVSSMSIDSTSVEWNFHLYMTAFKRHQLPFLVIQ